jgi:hypothetical protein
MRARRRELVMTPNARVGLWPKLIAARLVDNMARAALRRPWRRGSRIQDLRFSQRRAALLGAFAAES